MTGAQERDPAPQDIAEQYSDFGEVPGIKHNILKISFALVLLSRQEMMT